MPRDIPESGILSLYTRTIAASPRQQSHEFSHTVYSCTSLITTQPPLSLHTFPARHSPPHPPLPNKTTPRRTAVTSHSHVHYTRDCVKSHRLCLHGACPQRPMLHAPPQLSQGGGRGGASALQRVLSLSLFLSLSPPDLSQSVVPYKKNRSVAEKEPHPPRIPQEAYHTA